MLLTNAPQFQLKECSVPNGPMPAAQMKLRLCDLGIFKIHATYHSQGMAANGIIGIRPASARKIRERPKSDANADGTSDKSKKNSETY